VQFSTSTAQSNGDNAIVAEGLTKRFGTTEALRGIDLAVPTGSICALLGPNGAGKTTTVRILTTLLQLDAGRGSVAGFDVMREAEQVRFKIGLSGQYASVDELLTGYANLEMVGRLYHLPAKVARRRADELLARFGLADAANRIAKTYSGGMRRRLDLAASLVASPPVLFLDEPTTGLDPSNRSMMWETLSELVAGGTTIVLTTQYLEEADRLADQIVVIDAGRVIASGTADGLKSQVGGAHVDVIVRATAQIREAEHAMRQVSGERPRIEFDARQLTAPAPDGAETLTAIVHGLSARGIAIDDIALRRPTLDEVFLRLTGHVADISPAAESSPQATDEEAA
jgi:ABC-2 type transport system ATP-binding protein